MWLNDAVNGVLTIDRIGVPCLRKTAMAKDTSTPPRPQAAGQAGSCTQTPRSRRARACARCRPAIRRHAWGRAPSSAMSSRRRPGQAGCAGCGAARHRASCGQGRRRHRRNDRCAAGHRRRRIARRSGGLAPCPVRSRGRQGPAPEDPDMALARNWRDGGYPYKNLMSRKNYEAQKYQLQVELLKLQAWIKDSGQRVRDPLRRPRCGRQGRHHQALHGAPEPARRACGGAGEALGGGARAVVLPALCAAPADARRDRPVRPQLVQPCRRRARDGFLHERRVHRVHAPGAGVRAPPGAQRRACLQVLVLGQPRRAASPLQGAAQPPAEAVEAQPDRHGLARQVGRLHPCQGRRCSSTPTPPTHRGR